MMSAIATWLSNLGAIFVKGSLLQVVEVFITFYLLFYFLRDRLAATTMITGMAAADTNPRPNTCSGGWPKRSTRRCTAPLPSPQFKAPWAA